MNPSTEYRVPRTEYRVAAVQRFQDLTAWQKARLLTREVYLATREPDFSRDFGLRDQIRRASVSIMANVAEGFERKGAGEFAHFLMIAKASCAEVGSHLYVALDVRYITDVQFESLYSQVDETGRVIAGLHRAVVARATKLAPTRNSALGTRNST